MVRLNSGIVGIFNKKAAILVALTGLVLSGCSSVRDSFDREAQERNPAPCPNVLVLPEASRMMKFSGDRAAENLAWSGEITNVRSSCRYYGDRPIEAEVTVDFSFGRGPMAEGNRTDVTYFVAVTRTNRDLIAKQEFIVPVTFKGNSATVDISDRVQNIIIPRKDENVSGINFEIIVGLSLSREEVLYNRSGKSLRFPNL